MSRGWVDVIVLTLIVIESGPAVGAAIRKVVKKF